MFATQRRRALGCMLLGAGAQVAGALFLSPFSTPSHRTICNVISERNALLKLRPQSPDYRPISKAPCRVRSGSRRVLLSSSTHSLLYSSRGSSSNEGDDIVIRVTAHLPPRRNGKNISAIRKHTIKTVTSYGAKKKTFTGRAQEPPMGDASYLRKRTEQLLRITKPGYSTDPAIVNTLSSRGMKADRRTFNWLIDSWAFSGELDAPDQAAALLRRMELLHKNLGQSIRPDVRSYNKVINAYSRSGRFDSGEQAERILKRMTKLYASSENTTVKPNTITYTSVIEAYANSGAEGAAQKAESFSEEMERLCDEGDPDVRPTVRSFNAVINAWAKSGEEGAAQAAENCLDRMEELYTAGNLDVKPNTFNYNSVMNAWANSGEEGAAARTEEILGRMERLYYTESGAEDTKPTTVSFNAVIDAWAKSGEEGGAERAELILKKMEELYESGRNLDAKPNVRSFNSVINAWAKSRSGDSVTGRNAAHKAEDILDRMELLYEAGNEDVKPDATSFSTVINAWARSRNFGKAERVLNIFRHMNKLYEAGNESVKPNVIIFNSVMNACAFTMGDMSEQQRAMEIAHIMLKELEQSKFGTPDQVTYGTFLKVFANQMPNSGTRAQIVEAVFRKCCKDGQVGNLVLSQLKSMTSEEKYEQLVGRAPSADVQLSDLPKEWWCNVIEGKRRRRQTLT